MLVNALNYYYRHVGNNRNFEFKLPHPGKDYIFGGQFAGTRYRTGSVQKIMAVAMEKSGLAKKGSVHNEAQLCNIEPVRGFREGNQSWQRQTMEELGSTGTVNECEPKTIRKITDCTGLAMSPFGTM
jgi:hypothetical protein